MKNLPAGYIEYEGVHGPLDLISRVAYINANMRREGYTSTATEVYRPLGAPGDEKQTREQDTSTGTSNVYYQYGRMLRGLTPEAANPYAGQVSRHTLGLAADMDSSSITRRDQWAANVGMARTIPSESWHYEIVGPVKPGIELPSVSSNKPSPAPTPKTEDVDMFLINVDDKAFKEKAVYLATPNGLSQPLSGAAQKIYLDAGLRVVNASGAERHEVQLSLDNMNRGRTALVTREYLDAELKKHI